MRNRNSHGSGYEHKNRKWEIRNLSTTLEVWTIIVVANLKDKELMRFEITHINEKEATLTPIGWTAVKPITCNWFTWVKQYLSNTSKNLIVTLLAKDKVWEQTGRVSQKVKDMLTITSFSSSITPEEWRTSLSKEQVENYTPQEWDEIHGNIYYSASGSVSKVHFKITGIWDDKVMKYSREEGFYDEVVRRVWYIDGTTSTAMDYNDFIRYLRWLDISRIDIEPITNQKEVILVQENGDILPVEWHDTLTQKQLGLYKIEVGDVIMLREWDAEVQMQIESIDDGYVQYEISGSTNRDGFYTKEKWILKFHLWTAEVLKIQKGHNIEKKWGDEEGESQVVDAQETYDILPRSREKYLSLGQLETYTPEIGDVIYWVSEFGEDFQRKITYVDANIVEYILTYGHGKPENEIKTIWDFMFQITRLGEIIKKISRKTDNSNASGLEQPEYGSYMSPESFAKFLTNDQIRDYFHNHIQIWDVIEWELHSPNYTSSWRKFTMKIEQIGDTQIVYHNWDKSITMTPQEFFGELIGSGITIVRRTMQKLVQWDWDILTISPYRGQASISMDDVKKMNFIPWDAIKVLDGGQELTLVIREFSQGEDRVEYTIGISGKHQYTTRPSIARFYDFLWNTRILEIQKKISSQWYYDAIIPPNTTPYLADSQIQEYFNSVRIGDRVWWVATPDMGPRHYMFEILNIYDGRIKCKYSDGIIDHVKISSLLRDGITKIQRKR